MGVFGQLVDLSPGMPNGSHIGHKRTDETQQGIGYEREAKLRNEQRQS
jgi:hypothetical protein